MKREVPEKVLDLIDELYSLTALPEEKKNNGIGWFKASSGMPRDGLICAVKFSNSDIINMARYDGKYSCWQYYTSIWLEVPELDASLELWHPLPGFDQVENT